MADAARVRAEAIARAITDALGGAGVFGVELFVRGEEVIFSEVSPRPHDTGLVTLISQELSQFALHVRAILGLPIPVIHQLGPSASCAVLAEGKGNRPRYHGVAEALTEPDTMLRLFGKPEVSGKRRMAVTLARGVDIAKARAKALRAAAKLKIEL
jgi:phosphoribosylglycinamide formyltransferase 2